MKMKDGVNALLIMAKSSIVEPIMPENGTDFQLEELCKYLECRFIERVALAHGLEMWLDEEGKLKDEPRFNMLASYIFDESYPNTDIIVGNAIVCRRGMVL
jgi:hypothetical protein